jgi:hypothetical protein
MKTDWKTVKRDRTIKTAERRVNSLLKGFELLGNMANSNNYHFKDGEVEKIISAVTEKMEREFSVLSGKQHQKRFSLSATGVDDVTKAG